MKLSHSLATTGLLAISLTLAACGNGGNAAAESNDGGTLRLGHVGAPDDVFTQSVELFDERLQEYTDGRWSVDNYPSSQLGNERDLVEGVSMGTVDMTLVTNAPIGNFVPEALFFDLPGLYEDTEHVERVMESPSVIDDHLEPALLESGMRLLGITHGGFRTITNDERPIETLDDLSGLQMRVQESDALLATYEALEGVSATPIPMGDLYSALDQGVVDGQENPAIMVRDFNFSEVQDHLTLSNHSYFPRYLLIDDDIWEGMSEEDQSAFTAAAEEMVEFKNKYYEEETDIALQELEEQGMQITEPAQSFHDEMLELMSNEVYPQFYSQIGSGDETAGEEIINEILSLRSDQ